MSKKAAGYIAVFLAVMLFFSVFSIAAFAETTNTTGQQMPKQQTAEQQTAEQQPTDQQPTDQQPANQQPTNQQPTNPTEKPGSGEDNSNGNVEHETHFQVTFDPNGGTVPNGEIKVTKGRPLSEAIKAAGTPTRKGYRFAGWEINGSKASGSMPVDSSKTLTADWTKEKSVSSSSRTESVDTRQRQVEAAASAAEQATSDPGTLSSENWGSLLGVSSATGNSSAALSSEAGTSSSAAEATGGFSTLFLAGVVLVLVGAAGVGTFIYLQFFRGRGGKGGPHGPHGPGGSGKATDDTIVFTDVNSYSDGKKHDGELFGAVRQRAPEEGSRAPERSAKQESASRPQYSEKAKAEPVENGKSDFDWEKFFNEDNRGE